MVLSVILNPFVEIGFRTKRLNLGETNLMELDYKISSGRGIISSKIIKELGGDITTLSIIGGKNGEFIKESMESDKIDFQYILSDEENPIHVKIIDEKGLETYIYEKDPVISPVDVKKIQEKFRELVDKHEVILFTDRTPNGICFDIFKHLISIAKDKEKITILDAKGEFLKQGLEAEPTIARVDKNDFDNLTGSSFLSIIKRFKNYNQKRPEYFLIHIDNNSLIFNYEDRYLNIFSKEASLKSKDNYLIDVFDGALSYYLNIGKDIYESILYAFYVSIKSKRDKIVKPNSQEEIYKEIVIKEV